MDAPLIRSYLSRTQIVRAPKSPLSTFGATRIEYRLVSPIDDLAGKTRLREGVVVSEKPKILTAEAFAERFKGFGAEAEEFAQWLGSNYRDVLRSLEYNFRNQEMTARVISQPPAEVIERIAAELDDKQGGSRALISCPDAAWSLAVMKLSLDESARSFPTHVRDLERRGLLEPDKKLAGRRARELEALFAAASAGDAGARDALGRKLREYGLFEQYEDRFLSLFDK